MEKAWRALQTVNSLANSRANSLAQNLAKSRSSLGKRLGSDPTLTKTLFFCRVPKSIFPGADFILRNKHFDVRILDRS